MQALARFKEETYNADLQTCEFESTVVRRYVNSTVFYPVQGNFGLLYATRSVSSHKKSDIRFRVHLTFLRILGPTLFNTDYLSAYSLAPLKK